MTLTVRAKHILDRSKLPLLISCAVVFIYSALTTYNQDKDRYEDSVHFGGDEANYQNIAVNFAAGYGFKDGLPDGMSTKIYKYAIYPSERQDKEIAARLAAFARGNNLCYQFDRSPGLPVLMAGVYKIFGVHPRYVKFVNVFLVSFGIMLFPLIGWAYWGRAGIASGIVAAYVANTYFFHEAWRIMSENLIFFSLVIWALGFMAWEKKPTRRNTAILGALTGLVIFVKISNVFLPCLFIFYIPFVTRNFKKWAAYSCIYISACLLFLAPWGIYAYRAVGIKCIPIKQLEGGLVIGNNENMVSKGTWTNDWRQNKESVYNKSDRNMLVKYLIFLKENRNNLGELYTNKINNAFLVPFSWIVEWMLLYYALFLIFRRGRSPAFPIIYLLCSLAFTLLFFGCTRISRPFVLFATIPAAYLPFYLWDIAAITAAKYGFRGFKKV